MKVTDLQGPLQASSNRPFKGSLQAETELEIAEKALQAANEDLEIADDRVFAGLVELATIETQIRFCLQELAQAGVQT